MSPAFITYGSLGLAIVLETIGTTSLKYSEQFTRPLPSLITLIAYAGAFYLLGSIMKTIPVGIAYAIWSGLGIVLISTISAVAFKQIPDLAACAGLGLIIAGVVVVNVFSGTVSH